MFLQDSTNTPVMIIGDFNSVLNQGERENCAFSHLDVKVFSHFLESNQLSSVTLINSMFTWYGPANKKSRLDRVILNKKWTEIGNWVSRAYPRRNSDHKAICLRLASLEGGQNLLNSSTFG